MKTRLLSVAACAALLLPVGATVAAADTPSPATSAPPTSASPTAPDPGAVDVGEPSAGEREVSLGSVGVTVPADWPVIDLDANPTTCVRLDKKVVYVGTPGPNQDCAARAVGRAEAIVVTPTDAVGSVKDLLPDDASAPPTIVEDADANVRRVVVPEAGVTVSGAWGSSGDSAIGEILESVTVDGAPAEPATVTQVSGSVAAQSAFPAVFAAQQRAVAVTARSAETPAAVGKPLFGGMAFDACNAPSTATMQAWRQSPYAAVGIYTSGSMRACPFQGGTAWINSVVSQGWGLIPIHVGLQAPCVTQTGLSLVSRDLATARSQGRSEASAAAAALGKLGLGAGTVVYLDLESYSMTDTNCSTVTVAFTSEWTKELHQRGYLSGVYGGAGSLMRDLTKAIQQRDPSFQPPDHIWVAHWNQLQTTRDTYSPQYYPDYYWTNHQRLHQYSGDTQETWGGVSLHIDRNWVDATLPGNATQTAYGANTLGPGSPGFVFTGDMRYWTPAPGKGAQQKAYSTGPSTGSEGNGATWSPTLEPGTYRVEANIPDASVATKGLYVLDSALGRTSVTLDQGTGGGYRLVGTVRVEQGRPASVHLADNGGGVSTKRIWADAIRFVPTQPTPAPTLTPTPTPTPTPKPTPTPTPSSPSVVAPTVSYRAHVSSIGWQAFAGDGALAGTTGRALSMEAIDLKLAPGALTGGLQMRAHVSKIGWMSWTSAPGMVGTTGRALPMEALELKLTGALADKYRIEYRAHVRNVGWQNWVADGQISGTTGRALPIEAVMIRLVPKA
ncbi:MAG TPA: DUF1906 domain-containing protein [Phycicoccus sp.]|nr:DUF1906 domain-containing protein [Phycicoccus sp.]